MRFRGQWWSKLQYEDMLRKEAEANRKRTEELAAHAEFSNAWSRQTKHFTINTNTSPELLDYYCELLETYYSAMDDRFNIKPSPTLARTSSTISRPRRTAANITGFMSCSLLAEASSSASQRFRRWWPSSISAWRNDETSTRRPNAGELM